MYGVDIASSRADDLDKAQLEYVKTVAHPVVLDIGCGSGGQSRRLAAAGASVVGVDVHDYEAAFAELQRELGMTEAQLRFVPGRVEDVIDTLEGTFDSVIFQRTIHYLQPDAAHVVLRKLKLKTKGKLFLSVTGCESAIGAAVDCTTALKDRQSELPPDAQEAFSITVPICPYTREELVQLLTWAGWSIEKCWTSAFGNHKAIAI